MRTLFISDVHIGCRHAQAEAFLEFLSEIWPERLYIVGDFVDGWRLKRNWSWSPTYNQILSRLLQLAEMGTQVYYCPGNHDNFLRGFPALAELSKGYQFLEIADEFVCELADGRRFAVIHGDQFDCIERSAQWLSVFNAFVYDQVLSLNWWLSRGLGIDDRSPYWLCAIVKDRVKRTIQFAQRFEASLLQFARERSCEGVICGHIHTPTIRHNDGLTYCNIGDWIENCTALVEDEDGTLKLSRYFSAASEPPRNQAAPDWEPAESATAHCTPLTSTG